MHAKVSTIYFATMEGVILSQDHIDVVEALRQYYSQNKHNQISLRKIHDALDENFHHKGGIKYLYKLFPGGPITQGCSIAGLVPPAGCSDRGFGSVA